MITDFDIRLARPSDARRIAELSRDQIEAGLAWRWTPVRVLGALRAPETNVAVARDRDDAAAVGPLAGFGIMSYGTDEAHLLLLAVHPQRRRQGLGRGLLAWLEAAACTAGVGVVHLEARIDNHSARAFYRSLGYREVRVLPGRYGPDVDSVHLARDLWLPA